MANEYKLGSLWRVEKGVVSYIQYDEDEVFVEIRCTGVRWRGLRPCSFSHEMFQKFCEKIGMPEWKDPNKANAYEEEPPVHIPDGMIKGVWEKKGTNEFWMWDLKIVGIDLEN